MRVLHMIWSAGGGGAERQLAYLAAGQRTLGLDVHVALVRGGSNLARLEASGATLHWLKSSGSYDPRLVVRAIRLMHKIRPTVAQTWLLQMDVVGGTAALSTRTPWIVSERSSAADYPNDIRGWLRRLLGRQADAIVCNSEVGLEFWRTSTVSTFIVPNALPLDEIAAASRSNDDYGEGQLILFAGRFDVVKNLPNLIRALGPVVAGRNVLALLCGTGPLEGEIRALIEASGHGDRIRVLGFREDVWSLMKRAAVVVAPSWYEGRPNSVLEAAAAGVPLVVSDIAAHRALLDDTSALFAAPDDPDAWSRAIAHALDERETAIARADVARRIVAESSIEAVAARYVDIYRKVIA